MNKVKVCDLYGGGVLLYQYSNRNKATSVVVGFRVGTKNNTQNGIAHFSEHMLFKGTNKRSKEQLENDLREQCGNAFNAFTADTYTAFVFNRVNSKLEDAFEVASDILLNSNITKRNCDMERGVILEEFNSYEDMKKYSITQEIYNLVYGANDSNRTAIGNKEDLEKITPKAVIEFRKRFYNEKNFIISVVGSEKLPKIKRLVKKYFINRFESGDNHEEVRSTRSVQSESGYQIVKKEIDNVLVNISLKCMGFNDEFRSSALTIYQDYLSGGIDGKLFKAVRDKGLAYSITSYKALTGKDGVFAFEFESSKENVNKVIDEIARVVGEIRKKGIDQHDINKIKENFLYYISERDANNMVEANANMNKFMDDRPFMDSRYINNMLGVSKEVIDEYFVDLFDKATPIFVTIGGRVKQSDVYNLDEIKSKLLK